MSAKPRIPVIMYHSVGHPSEEWLWTNLTVSVELFEKQLALLRDKGFRTITLDGYRERQESPGFSPQKEVVLTFDDGYLDNWVYTYPLLKRAGLIGTIYVNPEFIDPGEEPRPNLEDVWAGRVSSADLQVQGFLNRGELRQLQKSGVMTIASHSMSHTWHPIAPEIIDFHRPDLDTPWLAWNRKPERKFAYLTEDQSRFVPYGQPIYKHGRSLGIRRFIPDNDAAEAALAWIEDHGAEQAFSQPEWQRGLADAVTPFAERGRHETDEEVDARYRYEIFQSRSILEEIIGQPVRHFCWPGGEYNDASWAVAEEAGYTTICVSSRDKKRWTQDNPALVRRIGCGSNFAFRDGRYYTDDPGFLLSACEIALGNSWAKWPYRWRKFVGAARTGFKPFKKSNKY